jgi:hypothetical protein
MRGKLARSLSLALGLVGTSASAGEWAAGTTPAASLGRPTAVRPAADPAVRRTAFAESVIGQPRPVVRAQSFDLPAPLPAGPEVMPGPGQRLRSLFTNRRVGESMPAIVASTPVDPTPRASAGALPAAPVPQAVPAWGMPLDGAPCGPACCDADPSFCEDGCKPYCVWLESEYLLWWIKDGPVPALVSTSPPNSAVMDAGVIGRPGTMVLFGGQDNDLQYQTRSGARFNAGWWFDNSMDCGLDGSLFFLGRRTAGFAASSSGVPILARPFFDARPGMGENAELVAFPGILGGTVSVESASRLWGADPNLRLRLSCNSCNRWDLLVGFRFASLEENLTVAESLIVTGEMGAPGLTGTQIGVVDGFSTRNYFYGGQLGLIREWRGPRWSFGVTGKLALGSTTQIAQVDGATRFTLPTGISSYQNGGLLALPSNIGRYDRTVFSVVPEVGVKLGWQATDHIRLTAGYSFLYWTNVARPGDQVDRVLNPTQRPTFLGPSPLAGAARPTFQFRDSDFWAHGVSFGLELLW